MATPGNRNSYTRNPNNQDTLFDVITARKNEY